MFQVRNLRHSKLRAIPNKITVDVNLLFKAKVQRKARKARADHSRGVKNKPAGDMSAETKLPNLRDLSGFEGPFHLASVLLDLLESSFCTHYSYSHAASSGTLVNGDSPMSVAIHLVTAITALHQKKCE